jgi:hypothetical protein
VLSRIALIARLAVLLLACLFAGALGAIRSGVLAPWPLALAAIAGAMTAAAAVALVVAIVRAVTSRAGRWARASEATLLTGLLLAAGAGLANWAFSYRGFVVLTEGEEVSIADGEQLQGAIAGPLARSAELEGRLRLAEVELTPAGPGGFLPASRVVLTRAGAPSLDAWVTPSRGAAVGPATLHQGAFGFSPRVVVQKGAKVVVDRTIPFTSRREGAEGVAFETRIDLEPGVVLEAGIDLSGLDERMKGHPRLAVELRRGERLLGAGMLSPGHGATMEEGWHVGFAGVKMWSEIDVSRRTYRMHLLAGIALALLGASAWGVAGWRRR